MVTPPTARIEPGSDPSRLALERFRQYLLLLARMHLGKQFQAKLDASDVVQQTLLQAHRSRDLFRGQNDAEMAGWLRQILACTLSKATRALGQAKRDLAREKSLQAELDVSSARLENFMAAPQSSPSQHVQGQERVLQLAEALSKLPDGQREAMVLRHCQGLSLAAISERLEKTPQAVAGLLQRGAKQLRIQLQEADPTTRT